MKWHVVIETQAEGAECYSEDFICTTPLNITVLDEEWRAVVKNRTTGRLAVINANKEVLLDIPAEFNGDCRALLYMERPAQQRQPNPELT